MRLTPKQNDVYQFIFNYNQSFSRPPTQTEIQEKFQFKSLGSVQRYLKYLKEAGYIENHWNKRRGITLLKKSNDSASSIIELPLLGNIAAGDPILAIENPDDTLAIPAQMVKGSGKFFALLVQGDSMIEEGIFDHDYIIAKYQQTANVGDKIIALVDGEATLKKFYPEADHIKLRPANSNYKDIIVGQDQNFKIAGILHGLIRSYGN